MNKMGKRKIEVVVWKGTFEEAEERDNLYWASRSEVERLVALMDIRNVFYGNEPEKIEKVVYKRRLYETEKA